MEMTLSSGPGVETDAMVDATTEHPSDDIPQPAEHLGAGIVLVWLVAGSALVATAIVAFGWRRTLEVWVGSGVLLGLICVGERFWHRHVRHAPQ
jgi:hypothetical protein